MDLRFLKKDNPIIYKNPKKKTLKTYFKRIIEKKKKKYIYYRCVFDIFIESLCYKKLPS
jgi:hypothetical protein